jgi:hypothetical protein
MMKRLIAALGLVAVVSVGATVVVAVSQPRSEALAAPPYKVEIAPDAHATRTAADVVARAAARIAAMRQQASGPATEIKTVTAVRGRAIGALVPNAAAMTGSDLDKTFWVVTASGTFVGLRVPPGQSPIVETTGYLIIDDASGDAIGMGMP